MIDVNELMTVRAALQFWEEEFSPHGEEAWRPYLEDPTATPLSSQSIQKLRESFAPANVRYATFCVEQGKLLNRELFVDAAAAVRVSLGGQVATVLLPRPQSQFTGC